MMPLSVPVTASIDYFPGDRRKRDVPALMDGLWHVLEKANVVVDDSVIRNIGYWMTHDLDKENPRIVVRLEPIKNINLG